MYIFTEKMTSLDACSRNMSIKTLIKEGMTYDVLKTVFQNCSSFMEFWKVLKDIGIDRKVAKHFTSQFCGIGLQNEKALGYCLHLAKQNGTADSNGLSENIETSKHLSSMKNNSHANTAASNSLPPENNNETPNSPCTDIISETGTGVSNGLVSQNSKESSMHHASLERIHKTGTAVSNELVPVINEGAKHLAYTDENRGTSTSCNSVVKARYVSSSQAFEQRPMDYALTSSSDEIRGMIYNANKTRNIEDNKEIDQESSKPGNSQDSSIESSKGEESENWDSEIMNSDHSEQFVLKVNNVFPVSVGIDDFTSTRTEKVRSKHMKGDTYKGGYRKEKSSGKYSSRTTNSDKEFVNNSKGNNFRESERNKNWNASRTQPSFQASKENNISNSRGNLLKPETTGQRGDNNPKTIAATASIDTSTIQKDKEKVDKQQTKSSNQISVTSNTVQKDGEQVDKQQSKTLNQESITSKPSPLNISEELKKQEKRSNKIGNNSTRRKENDPSVNKKSKKKRNKQTSSQQRSVTFVHSSPGSPNLEGKETTAFFVGDVEILVPVEKIRDNRHDTKRDNAHDIHDDKRKLKHQDIMRDINRDKLDDNKRGDNSEVHVHKETLSLQDKDIPSRDDYCDSKCDNVEKNVCNEDDKALKSEISNIDDTANKASKHKEHNIDNTMIIGETTPERKAAQLKETKEEMKVHQIEQKRRDDINDTSADPLVLEDTHNTAGSTDLDDQKASSNESTPESKDNDMIDAGSTDTEDGLDFYQLVENLHDGTYPSMYPVQPMPFTYPVPGLPPAVPAGYGFYPPMAPMMPMFPGPGLMPFPGIPFPGHQGFVPFGGYQHRYPLPAQMYQPTMYHPNLDNPGQIDEIPVEDRRESPEILGIPYSDVKDNNNMAINTDKGTIVDDSFSTTSDEHSESLLNIDMEGSKKTSSVAAVSREERKRHRRSSKDHEKHEKRAHKVKRSSSKHTNEVEIQNAEHLKTTKADAKEATSSGNSSHLPSPQTASPTSPRDLSTNDSPAESTRLDGSISRKAHRNDSSLSSKSTSSSRPFKRHPMNGEATSNSACNSTSPRPLKKESSREDVTSKPSNKTNRDSSKEGKPKRQVDASPNVDVTSPSTEAKSVDRDEKVNTSNMSVSVKKPTMTPPRKSKEPSKSDIVTKNGKGSSNSSKMSDGVMTPKTTPPKTSPSSRDSSEVHSTSNEREHYSSAKKSTTSPKASQPLASSRVTPHESALKSYSTAAKATTSGPRNPTAISGKNQERVDSRTKSSLPRPSTSKSTTEKWPQNTNDPTHQHSSSKKSKDVSPKYTPPMKSSRAVPKVEGSPKASDCVFKTKQAKSPNRSQNVESSKGKALSLTDAPKEQGSFEKKVPAYDERDSKETKSKTITEAAKDSAQINEYIGSAPDQSTEAARRLKWPLSAWSGGSIPAPPKPQREPLARKRVYETQVNPEECSKNISIEISKKDDYKNGNDIRGSQEKSSERGSTTEEYTKDPSSAVLERDKKDSHKNKRVEMVNNNNIASEHVLHIDEKPGSTNSRTTNYRDILMGKSKSETNSNSTMIDGSPKNNLTFAENDNKRSDIPSVKQAEHNNNNNVKRFAKTNTVDNTIRTGVVEPKDNIKHDNRATKPHKRQTRR